MKKPIRFKATEDITKDTILEVPETANQDAISKEPDAIGQVIKHPRRNACWVVLKIFQEVKYTENLEPMEHFQRIRAE